MTKALRGLRHYVAQFQKRRETEFSTKHLGRLLDLMKCSFIPWFMIHSAHLYKVHWNLLCRPVETEIDTKHDRILSSRKEGAARVWV